MTEPADPVAELLAERRIERVSSDSATVQRMLQQAALNADGAVREANAGNPSGAHALLWDAVRQAITAHMLSNGLRPTSAAGHHATVILYAESRLSGLVDPDDIMALDRIRRTRHRSEYDAIPVSRATFDGDAPTARRVVQRVVGTLVDG